MLFSQPQRYMIFFNSTKKSCIIFFSHFYVELNLFFVVLWGLHCITETATPHQLHRRIEVAVYYITEGDANPCRKNVAVSMEMIIFAA